MKILIVDDVRDTCEFIAQVITEQYNNFICHTAYSYESAIDLLNNNMYDVIVLDYELDKSDSTKNGLALGKCISRSMEYKNTPIVFATSYPEHIYSAVNMLNCAYYMIKPFYRENILDMMNKILSCTPDNIKLTIPIYLILIVLITTFILALLKKLLRFPLAENIQQKYIAIVQKCSRRPQA